MQAFVSDRSKNLTVVSKSTISHPNESDGEGEGYRADGEGCEGQNEDEAFRERVACAKLNLKRNRRRRLRKRESGRCKFPSWQVDSDSDTSEEVQGRRLRVLSRGSAEVEFSRIDRRGKSIFELVIGVADTEEGTTNEGWEMMPGDWIRPVGTPEWEQTQFVTPKISVLEGVTLSVQSGMSESDVNDVAGEGDLEDGCCRDVNYVDGGVMETLADAMRDCLNSPNESGEINKPTNKETGGRNRDESICSLLGGQELGGTCGTSKRKAAEDQDVGPDHVQHFVTVCSEGATDCDYVSSVKKCRFQPVVPVEGCQRM
ncbi:unnamed protein product [Choristocarpus tenellus]